MPQKVGKVMMVNNINISIGDKVIMKKPHPCGANEWEVCRLGMEIGLICLGCGHKVRLERPRFNSRYRGHLR